MSYNIDHVEYLGKGRLSIRCGDARDFAAEHHQQLAEGNFLDQLFLDVPRLDDNEMLVIERPWWYGDFSGRYFDTFKEALALTKGSADLVLYWEGGDSVTGLRVRDGKVEEKKVKMVLED